MKKEETPYLNIATKILTCMFSEQVSIVSSIIVAHADRDYKTIIKNLETVNGYITDIIEKTKEEGNL